MSGHEAANPQFRFHRMRSAWRLNRKTEVGSLDAPTRCRHDGSLALGAPASLHPAAQCGAASHMSGFMEPMRSCPSYLCREVLRG